MFYYQSVRVAKQRKTMMEQSKRIADDSIVKYYYSHIRQYVTHHNCDIDFDERRIIAFQEKETQI